MKTIQHIRTKSGRKPRARLHSPASPLGRRRSRRALIRTVAATVVIVFALGIVGDAYATSFMDSLPDIHSLDASSFRGDTLVYDRSGVLLGDIGLQGDHRLDVTLDQVSPKLIEATVATEDQSFWSNPGFNPEAILRAGLADISHRSIVGGGSTITQQLAKQLFLTPDQNISRKVKEIALAWQLNQAYTKRQILELYLNENSYGQQQYGVQSASLAYFKKSAHDVDLAQASLLAGLPQSPALYDPVEHFDNAKARQQQVLSAMVRAGYITTDEAAAAFAEPLAVSPPVNSSLAPHFIKYVESELERLGVPVGSQQLVVRTTLDWNKQQLGESIVRDNLQKNLYRDKAGQLSSAMVALDPTTGQILAYVGSPGYNDPGGQFDFVDGVDLNPGSSLKPFTYGAALDARKITMDTPIADSPSPLVVPQGPGYQSAKIFNYDHRSHGVQPARVALASSLNIPAVKVELTAGLPTVYSFYQKVGLHPLGFDGAVDGPPEDYGPTLTLGGHAIKLLDEATAYSVYADLGVYHQPEAILQVTNLHGQVLYQANPANGQRQAIDPGVAFIVDSILADDSNRALIFGYNSPVHLRDRHSAGKTGTTESFKDALTAGLTPSLVSVFWVGDILGIDHTMTNGSDGIYVAAPAWNRFMEAALKGVPDAWYQPPADVVKGAGNSYFLKDTPSIASLGGEQVTPTPTPYAPPPDPGTGPVRCLPFDPTCA